MTNIDLILLDLLLFLWLFRKTAARRDHAEGAAPLTTSAVHAGAQADAKDDEGKQEDAAKSEVPGSIIDTNERLVVEWVLFSIEKLITEAYRASHTIWRRSHNKNDL